MKKILLLIPFILLLGCTLITPSSLTIINKSSYNIKIEFIELSEKLYIDKNKSDTIYSYPKKITTIISIEETGYKEEFVIDIGYLSTDNLEFSFDGETISP